MDQQRRMEKKNKTLGAERWANIDTLYINDNIIIIIIIIIVIIIIKFILMTYCVRLPRSL